MERVSASGFDMTMLDAEKTAAVDLMSPQLLQDWRRHATQWATEPPFYVASFGFPQAITGTWADARAVLLDRERFSALTPPGHPLGLFDIFKGLPQLNSMEGESHDRIRRLLMPFFSGTKVAEVADGIGRLVAEMLDAVDAAGGEFDAMSLVAEPLVERTLLEIIFSVEPEQQREFTAYSHIMPLSMQPTPEGQYQPAFVEQWERTTGLIEQLLEDRRREPRGDLITTLVSAQDDGFAVTHEEMIGNVLAVYAGAQLATATSIGVLLMNLAAHPEEYARVRADPALIPSAVDESLRYHPAGLFGFPRYALVDHDLGGTPVWEGMAVQVGLASANLDPAKFPDPNRFDVTRDTKGALSFSVGAHHCIGSMIARAMLQATARGVVERYGELRLADPGFQPHYGGVMGELKPDEIPMVARP